jgi:O-antigen/teichoic acid export membrane protein
VINRFRGKQGLSAMLSMGMLYASRTSSVLVGFVFLPLYSRLLGAEQFGVVAVILSMQALLMMLDLGMSVLVSRDLAMSNSDSAANRLLIRNAKLALTGFYAILLSTTIMAKLAGAMQSVSFITVISAVVLFWILVLQNLYAAATIACRAYTLASAVQLFGVIARAGITALVLAKVSPTLEAFVITQLIVSALHLLGTRWSFAGILPVPEGSAKVPRASWPLAWQLLKRGRSLALFSLAGAAVMQLDKPIISAFVSAAEVAPYFLATTLCIVPLTVLAGPVSQYFQPQLLNAMYDANIERSARIIRHFSFILPIVTLLPGAIFWMLRAPFIELWMGHHGVNNAAIVQYVGILLPGFAIGALGYIPYSLLLSAKDFKFQAWLSVMMTLCTLIAAVFFAWTKNVENVCYVYVTYHCSSTLLSWWRAISLDVTRQLAITSFKIATTCFAVIGLFVILIRFFY